MGLEKRIFNWGKKAAVGAILIGMLALGACRNSDPPRNPPVENQAPQTTIEYTFNGDNVDYTIRGTDSDGYVKNIKLWKNGNYSQEDNPTQTNPYTITFSVPVRIGDNTLTAKSTDDEGLENLEDTTSSFTVNPPINQSPETTINAIVNGDNLDYIVCGTDSDGHVSHISLLTNGVISQENNPTTANPYCFDFSKPIIPGDNTLVATATDNDALTDPTGATFLYNQVPPGNQEPVTTVTRSFNDGFSGEVDYTACASDSDGLVDRIDMWANGVSISTLYNVGNESLFCVSPPIGIIPEDNAFEARAVDRENLADSSNATSSFYSPKNEAESRAIVDAVLAKRGLVEGVDYEKDITLTINEFNPVVDYNFLCSSGIGTRAVLETISHDEVYDDEIAEEELFSAIGMPNRYIAYLPEEEAIPRIENFLDVTLPSSPACP